MSMHIAQCTCLGTPGRCRYIQPSVAKNNSACHVFITDTSLSNRNSRENTVQTTKAYIFFLFMKSMSCNLQYTHKETAQTFCFLLYDVVYIHYYIGKYALQLSIFRKRAVSKTIPPYHTSLKKVTVGTGSNRLGYITTCGPIHLGKGGGGVMHARNVE